MKKVILLSAAVIGAFASCSKDLDLVEVNETAIPAGISFTSEEAPETRMMWNETDNAYNAFWYAEVDRVGIYASNVNYGYPSGTWKGTYSWSGQAAQGWHELGANGKVFYKATKSTVGGNFTSVSDDDLLTFANGNDAKFFAVFPDSMVIDGKAGAAYKGDTVIISKLPEVKSQTLDNTKGQNIALVQYGSATAKKSNDYDAVGEKVALTFQRPLSALVFTTKNLKAYKDNFGILNKITVTTTPTIVNEGEENEATIPASMIAYDEEKASIKINMQDGKSVFVSGDGAVESNVIELNVNMSWSDDALAIAAIKNVDRSAYRKAGVKESIKITYDFQNITLTQTVPTANDWNGFIEVPALNIDEYKYLVINGNVLYVNNCSFSSIFTQDEQISWPSGNVNPSDIEELYSKVELTDNELKKIANFTSLKKLSLAENTKLAANTFGQANLGTITYLNAPKVSNIDANFASYGDWNGIKGNFTALKTLNLNSYAFGNKTVIDAFFKCENGTLESLNIASASTMVEDWATDATLDFSDFTALNDITVKDGFVVSRSGFKGCTSLNKVNGKVDISNAPEAFKGCENLEYISLANQEIPGYAFSGCKKLQALNGFAKDWMGNVNYRNYFAPVSVGDNAFENSGLYAIDLSKATTIGKEAFLNCAALQGTMNKPLEVAATVIEQSTFEGCTALKYINFKNAEQVQPNILKGCTLTHIKFDKVFSLVDGMNYGSQVAGILPLFGNEDVEFSGVYSNTTLYVNKAQTGINKSMTNELSLGYKYGGTSYVNTFKFKQIYK